VTKKAAAVDEPGSGIVNEPLEKFLIKLSVDAGLRGRFSDPSVEKRRRILIDEFEIGDDTAEAVLSGVGGRVKVRFKFSDQQGTPKPPPPSDTKKPGKKPVKKAAKKAAKKTKAPAGNKP
jgi:hypothetical protein